MIRLRSKLWLGFRGLLLILLFVTVTSIVVLNRYSNALHRTFRENYESLRRADELKSGLVATVSHEWRTPLTSIRMGVLMLADGTLGPLTPRQQQSLAAVRDDSDRLNRIIEDLLNMSRIEAGTAQFQFIRMSVEEIVSQAEEALRRRIAKKHIRLTTEVPAALPAVMADPSCIGLALTNFLSNALKYTPRGGEVGVTAGLADGFLCLVVSDTGPGIPQQYAQRIFEKFFRLPNKDGPQGAGLGLAIAREIVEAHGGWVRYRAKEHGGSEFSLGLTAPSADAKAGEA
jgi:NtrC-family two-component system sensor histidine kinase KinB